jgi:hypothetical protein
MKVEKKSNPRKAIIISTFINTRFLRTYEHKESYSSPNFNYS